MLTLYGCIRSRASRNVWLAHEAGLAFRLVPVVQAYRPGASAVLNTRSPEFLKVNPNGHIPTLDDDGLVLHESLAINLYLARQYGGTFGPADGREDGLMGMWSLWAATEVEPHSIEILYNRAAKPPAERDEAKALTCIAALRAPFAVLDQALAETGFLVGGRFTVADINVAECVRYAMPAPELFTDTPHLNAWLTACHGRAAYKRMMTEREAEPA